MLVAVEYLGFKGLCSHELKINRILEIFSKLLIKKKLICNK